MPERSAYAHGTPCWVDLASPDVDASVAFYGGLLGWDASEPGPVQETGGYRMFTLRDKAVAGVGPCQDPAQPTVWTTYLAADDADAVAAKVPGAGGRVVMPPMDVMDAGRLAVFTDSVGAAFGIWQAGRHRGAQLVNEPGTMAWNELATREVEPATAFYSAVFGLGSEPWEGSGDTPYTVWTVDGTVVGGVIQMDETWPEGVPPHWMAYFAVDDADATAARAKELGGNNPVAPFDAPGVGRIAVLTDPHETHFAVIAIEQPGE